MGFRMAVIGVWVAMAGFAVSAPAENRPLQGVEPSGGQAVAPVSSKADEAIWQVVRDYVEATRVYQVSRLEALFHADYLEISPIGEIDPRDKTLGFYRIPDGKKPPSPDSITVVPVSLRRPGRDVAVAVYSQVFAMGTAKVEVRTTTILRKQGREWKLYSNQFTAVQPKRKK